MLIERLATNTADKIPYPIFSRSLIFFMAKNAGKRIISNVPAYKCGSPCGSGLNVPKLPINSFDIISRKFALASGIKAVPSNAPSFPKERSPFLLYKCS